VAEEFLVKCVKQGQADITVGKSRWLLSLMDNEIGALPVGEITPAQYWRR